MCLGRPTGVVYIIDEPTDLSCTCRYNIFLSEKRECVREEHGASSMSAVSKVMGQMWSQLSGEEKAFYYDQAERDRKRYIREMKSYFSQLYKGM